MAAALECVCFDGGLLGRLVDGLDAWDGRLVLADRL